MAISRVRVARDKAELVQGLLEGKDTTGPFQTYADVMVFAAVLGAKWKKRLPVEKSSNTEPGPIALDIFISRGYEPIIKVLAIAETHDLKILSPYNREAEETRIQIFEEYANGGLLILQEELRGAVDYTERILLMLSDERFHKETDSVEEFDLSRFL
ncbi:DNA phosphorothioation-associated protein 4 [Spirulina subsalsa]|uniref:DNA phosphorothioation-associated protein 4 n=1 Tax=Spirulina subsalsa TaxID=54311 RepID=UPI0002FF6184|nr:DNA phosphorothioation-associated protein 4 [Spirulina subsalsa]